MSSCEKCWADAGGDAKEYQRLLEERKNNPCTPEEHAGPNAQLCMECFKYTVHQHTHRCVVCGMSYKKERSISDYDEFEIIKTNQKYLIVGRKRYEKQKEIDVICECEFASNADLVKQALESSIFE